MKAIVTKYHGPTDTKGSRISAKTEGQPQVFVSYDSSLNSDGNHDAAMMALAKKLEWHSTWHRGGMPDGKGYVYVATRKGEKGIQT